MSDKHIPKILTIPKILDSYDLSLPNSDNKDRTIIAEYLRRQIYLGRLPTLKPDLVDQGTYHHIYRADFERWMLQYRPDLADANNLI